MEKVFIRGIKAVACFNLRLLQLLPYKSRPPEQTVQGIRREGNPVSVHLVLRIVTIEGESNFAVGEAVNVCIDEGARTKHQSQTIMQTLSLP